MSAPACTCTVASDSVRRAVIHCPLHAAAGEMFEALKALHRQFGNRSFVRNITLDSEPDWAIRQIPLVRALQLMDAALRAAEDKERAARGETEATNDDKARNP